MGEALVAGLIRGSVTSPEAIRVADIAAGRLDLLRETYKIGIAGSNAEAADGADFLLLAVKPQDFPKVASSISGKLAGEATVISIMAGVTLQQLSLGLKHDGVVRAMPNTPAQIGEGMTVWTATAGVSETARHEVSRILTTLGKSEFVPEEKYVDMATALSGSGPGYVFLFIEALIDAGVHIGLSRPLATEMALQTVAGSARFAQETGKHPAELRNMVTSPGGTTAEGLQVLEASGLRASVTDAVLSAYEKARRLGGGS